MPVREPLDREAQSYSYDELLMNVRRIIDDEHGGVAKFIGSEKFIEIGFKDTKSERGKFHTYLACQSDKSKTVKSFPVLQRLYKGLLGVDLESKIKVERTQVILSNQHIDIVE